MSLLENRSVGQQFLAEEDQTMEQISQLTPEVENTLNEPFWRMMLACGEIPGMEDIPRDVGIAVAMRVSRYMESHMDSTEGRALAAFVLLALEKEGPVLPTSFAAQNLRKLLTVRCR